MTKIYCFQCEEEVTNPVIIIKEFGVLGYMEREFCSVNCFLEYIIKKYKRKIKRFLR